STNDDVILNSHFTPNTQHAVFGELVTAVTDQRLFLAAEADNNSGQNSKHHPRWRIELCKGYRIPRPVRQMALNGRLQFCQRTLVDNGPSVADFHVDQRLVGDGFGAVIDEENKGQRQQTQADKTK